MTYEERIQSQLDFRFKTIERAWFGFARVRADNDARFVLWVAATRGEPFVEHLDFAGADITNDLKWIESKIQRAIERCWLRLQLSLLT